MAPMKQQPIPDDSLSESEAIRLVRGLSGGRRPRGADGQIAARAVLARTVEEEVLPRLVTARRTQARVQPHDGDARPQPADVEQLTRLVVTGTQPQAAAYVQAVQARGVSPERLCLDLLTQSARRLGEMWEDDSCDFTDVTIGVLRLNNVMRLVSDAFNGNRQPGKAAPRALLVQAPGEQHGFGLAMVAQFFRRAGWHVHSEAAASRAALADLVRQNWFNLVGISVSCSNRMDQLAADIAAVRAASRNPALGVMVGGPPFIERPHLAAMIGADGTATDGLTAVDQAHALMARLARA